MVFYKRRKGSYINYMMHFGGKGGSRLMIVTYNYYLKNENFKLYIICTETVCNH